MYTSTVIIVIVCPNLLLPSRSGDFKKKHTCESNAIEIDRR